MEHLLNGQYVLGCQLLYYKLCCLFIHILFHLFLFSPVLHVSIFVCQDVFTLIVALQAVFLSKGRGMKKR